MCGIAGCLGRSTESLEDIARGMTQAVIHRGPDGGDVWVDRDAQVALGHRRLAILDLSPEGSQPMHSACGRYVIVFNGEIYNFAEIRADLERGPGSHPAWRGHSDTEIMLAAISRWGVKPAIERFVGMFAFALWDRQERKLYLARDRLGEKPLYYGWLGESFVFGSELKALRQHPRWTGSVDRGALSLYMRHGYVPGPYTIFEGVSKLPPASLLTVRAPETGRRFAETLEEYWSLRNVSLQRPGGGFTLGDMEAVDRLETLLAAAIKQQMVADVPLGAFLSGGIDSSVVVSLMQAQCVQPVRTFTIGFQEADYNEAEAAKKVAAHLGTDHTELYVSPSEAMAVIPRLPALYDEPFADASQIPTFLVSQLARRHVTVSLSGDGGDELFGGYTRYAFARGLWRRIGWIPQALRGKVARILAGASQERWDRFFGAAAWAIPASAMRTLSGHRVHRLAGVLAAHSPETLYRDVMSYWSSPASVVIGGAEPPTPLSDGRSGAGLPDIVDRMMYLDSITYLPDDILVKVDRAAMGVSLESRVPLLDHRVVEFAWSLPQHVKIRHSSTKWPLRQILQRYVPLALTDRPKMGFGVPLGPWLRGPLREWADALLDGTRLQREGYFSPGPIRKMWREHLSGRYDRQYYLWNVLMFQAWQQAYA